jgi:NADPH:quinone reductase
MVEIRRSTVIPATADELWAALRDFNGHALWHPAVAASVIEGGEASDRVGAVRSFRLKDGSRIREQLLFLSDAKMSFAYCILEAPAPLRNYVASVRLRPVTDERASLWEWRASFEPPPAERESLVRFVRDDIIEAGFLGMRQFLRGQGARPAPVPLAAPSPGAQAGLEAVEIALTRYGGPEVLELRPTRAREPDRGEARIRQTAVGVNFIDVYCRRGSFDLVAPGGVLGMEAAGIVESVGPNVASLKPGDRVAYACAPAGAYASIRTMGADLIVRLPETLTEMNAAALMLKGMTAGFLLHEVAQVKAGSIVVVHAAAGGVGQILCRWAKALGATVIGATSSEAKAEKARRAGCAAVVLHGREDLAAAVMRLTDGRGADIVYDAVGKDTFELSVGCLAPRGHLVSFGQASGDVGTHSIDRLSHRSITLSRPNYVHYTDDADKVRRQSERLFEALRSGAVVAARPTPFPLAEAARAHAELESRRTTGALVLIP